MAPRKTSLFQDELTAMNTRTIYKALVVLINHYIGKDPFLKIIGFLNQRYGFLNSVFVMYPASKDYTIAYAFEKYLTYQKWSPWIVGFFRQNGQYGIKMTISGIEKDFLNGEEGPNLKSMVFEAERIRQLVGAKQKTFAGILPGVLYAKRIITDTTEANVTVEAVAKAVSDTLSKNSLPAATPIIVLGGRGFVGRRLVTRLNGSEVYNIDLNNQDDFPLHLKGKDALLINVSRKAAIKDYISLFWKGLIILNEVYPPPAAEELEKIAAIGCPVYHLVGVAAKAYPSFPSVYNGGIPCCAAWNSGDQMQVIVKQLI